MMSLVNKVFGHHIPWLELGLAIVTGIIGAHIYARLERLVLGFRRGRAAVPAE
jgi:hypothetical protein